VLIEADEARERVQVLLPELWYPTIDIFFVGKHPDLRPTGAEYAQTTY
jgi:hypothetical protein